MEEKDGGCMEGPGGGLFRWGVFIGREEAERKTGRKGGGVPEMVVLRLCAKIPTESFTVKNDTDSSS